MNINNKSQPLGTAFKESTKIPYKAKKLSNMTELHKHVSYCQEIIKAYQAFLLDEVHDGNQTAINALSYTNVINMSLAMGTISSKLEKNIAIKEKADQKKKSGGTTPPLPESQDKTNKYKESLSKDSKLGNWYKSMDDHPSLKPKKKSSEFEPDMGKGVPQDYKAFGSGSPDNEVEIPGTDMSVKNTFDATTPGEVFADCIPCSFRLIDLNGWNPLRDILNALLDQILAWIEELKKLWNMLFDYDFSQDICSLLAMLNFMCIPDLYAIMVLLQYYISQIIAAFYALVSGGNITLLWGLLSPLFLPLFTGLTDLIDAIAQMILGPINCIISNLIITIQKLGGVSKSGSAGLQEMAYRAFNPPVYENVYDSSGKIVGTTKVVPPQYDSTQIQEYNSVKKQLHVALQNCEKAKAELIPYDHHCAEVDILTTKLDRMKGDIIVPTLLDENKKREIALKDLTSKNRDVRAKGFSNLDAEGWLRYVQTVSNKSIYLALSFIRDAQDAFNKKLAELNMTLLSFFNIEGNMMDLKTEIMEKLQRIAMLISMIEFIINILETGELQCFTDPTLQVKKTNFKEVVQNSLVKGMDKAPKTKAQQLAAQSGLDNLFTPTTIGDTMGFVVGPTDIDPVSGAYIPPTTSSLSGAISEKEIVVNSASDIKGGHFFTMDNCLGSSTSSFDEIQKLTQEVDKRRIELGLTL